MKFDIFGKEISNVLNKKLFLFDMDGTVYLEWNFFDGILDLFKKIKDNGGIYVFITNNPSKNSDDYLKKMIESGVECTRKNFFTSAEAASYLINKEYPGKLVYAQGSESFVNGLIKDGLNVTTDKKENIDIVLVSYDTELTYEKMRKTCEILTKQDVKYYATNPDWVCPTYFGYVPDCGSLCFSYEKATGKSPIYIGKPNPLMIQLVMDKFNVKKEDVVVIGDRIYTDIASGVNAGVDTILVLSGEATLKDYENSNIKPTYVLNNIVDLIR